MQAGKKLSSHEPWNKKIIERFERKIQKMMQYIPFQYQHMLLTEEQKNSVMVISVELANVCLHACLGAKVSGEELWHLISHMNNHFMGKKKPSRTSETAKKKKAAYGLQQNPQNQQTILKQSALIPIGSLLPLTRGTSKCFFAFQTLLQFKVLFQRLRAAYNLTHLPYFVCL